MITVYRLRDNYQYIKHVQEATLGTKEFGVQQTHGLFGSDAWWQQIASGALPLQIARGHIVSVYMGSMGDWPEFKMLCSDGTERTHTRELNNPQMDSLYRVGASIEIDYVVQHFKQAAYSKGAAHDCVIEIRLGHEA
jgi:hypothetical protein